MEAVRIEIRLAEHVVDGDAGTRDHAARTGAIGDREGRNIAIRIGHRDLGGAAAGGGERRHLFAPGLEKLRRKHVSGPVSSIHCGRSHPRRAGAAQNRGEQRGMGVPRGRQIPDAGTFEQGEPERHQQTAGSGRRIALDHSPPERDLERLPDDRLIGLEIRRRENAGRPGRIQQCRRHLAPIEEIGPLMGERIQRIREFRLPVRLALLQDASRQAGTSVEGAARLGGQQQGRDEFEIAGLDGIDPDPLPGMADGGCQQFGDRHAREIAVDGEIPRRQAGHRRRSPADMEFLDLGAEMHIDRAEIQLVGRGRKAPRSLHEEVIDP